MELAPHQKAYVEPDYAEMLSKVFSGCEETLSPLLPYIFTLKGEPFRLDDYFPFEALYRRQRSRRRMLLTGRQVAKSTNVAVQQLIEAAVRPHITILTMLPLYEMSRRFSQNYIRPLIQQSTVPGLFTDPDAGTRGSVTQRSFPNGSQIIYSYAVDDATRTRGVPADMMFYDEVQDADLENAVEVAIHTMDASPLQAEFYSGTPKGFGNSAARLFDKSSQAEWVIPCLSCKKWNIPTIEHDLMDMIGPWNKDISEKYPGTVCAGCKKCINPRNGHWVHAYPERAHLFEGYHIPQILLPLHYANPDKWLRLWSQKQQHEQGVGTKLFYNESLGIPYDDGSQMVTVADLRATASLPWDISMRNTQSDVVSTGDICSRWVQSALGVDWGGGGASGLSLTKSAVVGLCVNGDIEVAWGSSLPNPHDHMGETEHIIEVMNRWPSVNLVAHDAANAGSVRETLLHQSGLLPHHIMPIAYTSRLSGEVPLSLGAATLDGQPQIWRLDKARAIQLVCYLIRRRKIRFFRSDPSDVVGWDLIDDFLAIYDDRVDGRGGPDRFLVRRDPSMSDDFVHAVTFACVAVWQMAGQWPSLSEANVSFQRRYSDTSQFREIADKLGLD